MYKKLFCVLSVICLGASASSFAHLDAEKVEEFVRHTAFGNLPIRKEIKDFCSANDKKKSIMKK